MKIDITSMEWGSSNRKEGQSNDKNYININDRNTNDHEDNKKLRIYVKVEMMLVTIMIVMEKL